ncbi:MAG: penicillin-binding protein, partial [Chitinophagaceae bacterium]
GDRGRRIVKYMAGGVFVPIKESEVEPESGKDLLTTLDVNIQDITETALHRMMVDNQCEYGTCIVMEVNTGKIKAIANLGRRTEGTYFEDLNYAIRTSEPGSTFKLATLLALLDDHKVNLNSRVNLEGGKWNINGRTVYDSEPHGLREVTVKQAFEHSSNVGMAKMTMAAYAKNPNQYLRHLQQLYFHQPSGIGLAGEGNPVVKNTQSSTWSATTLPWMSFGYEVQISPIQTLMLYNAVANGGKLFKPYLVNAVLQNGLEIKSFQPQVLNPRVSQPETIRQLQECLEGVCQEEGGTAYKVFKNSPYRVAGKTGTALMANGNRGYADHIYQSSFAGYFPADQPMYSCIVVIRNKPAAAKFYGATVAAPVFKEIADKLYVGPNRASLPGTWLAQQTVSPGNSYSYLGFAKDLRTIFRSLQWNYRDSAGQQPWGKAMVSTDNTILKNIAVVSNRMPDVRGMGLRDALYVLESCQVKVSAVGRGKVKQQSLAPGSPLRPDQQVWVMLN